MTLDGVVVVILGALDAFPRRLAAREITARGGVLRRTVSRRTDIVVAGHRLAEWRERSILQRLAEAGSAAALISENAFLILLGLRQVADEPRQISRQALIDQSGLDAALFDRINLFDVFDMSAPPYGFRDLVAARQYSSLIADGVGWLELIRSIRMRSPVSAASQISASRLESSDQRVLMRDGDRLTELDGQHVMALESSGAEPVDRLFEEAEDAELDENWDLAVRLYRRCMEVGRADPDIAFNLANALLKMGDTVGARHGLNRVLSIDPDYAEAWYNLAVIASTSGDGETASRHLRRAMEADPGYSDPVYNLARMEFEAGRHDEAGCLWQAYLALDDQSDWAEKARRGLRLIEIMKQRPDGSSADAESDAKS